MNLDYDEISPITGNKCVVVEADPGMNIQSYLCMESGYTTTDQLVNGSTYVEKHEENLTELMVKARMLDQNNLLWYPTFMQMPGGMLYPEGNPQKIKWRVAKVIPIFGEERLKYPVPGEEGEYYTSKLDVENANIYDTGDFKLALEELYDIVKKTLEHEDKLRDNSMQ